MKITADNVHKLTPEAQDELLNKLLNKVHDMDFDNDGIDSIPKIKPLLLAAIIQNLDDLDEDDFFGTEGWRHSLLGED